MAKQSTFTEETEIAFEPTDIQDVHLNDLAFILDIERDGAEIESCTIDIHKLVQVMTLYSSMEEYRYDWRRGSA